MPKVRKLKNHRHSLFELIFSLPFLLTFSVGFGRCLSVIVSVSPLCFKGTLFPTALFKTAFLKYDRYFLLSHSLISSFTLRCHYSLPTHCSTVDSRSLMFWQVIRGGVVGPLCHFVTSPLSGAINSLRHTSCATSLKEGGKKPPP